MIAMAREVPRSRPRRRTALRLLVVAMLLPPAAAMAAGQLLGEQWWVTAALLYLPYFVFLAPALVALAITIKLGWGWRIFATVVVATLALWGMGFNVPTGAEDGKARVRVMTYNIKSYIALDDSIEARLLGLEIARHDPDVVVMQDARGVTGLPVAEREALVGCRHFVLLGQYGIASRHPVRDCGYGNIDFRGHAHTYARCVLSVEGREVDLVTVHLLTPREGLNALRFERLRGIGEWRENVGDRLSQATTLAAAITRRQRPVILAGDLNAPPRSIVMDRLREADLRDAHEAAGTGYGFTYGHSHKTRLPFLRIDHVMVTPEIGVVRTFPGESRASPHLPVIADLHLDRIVPTREPRS